MGNEEFLTSRFGQRGRESFGSQTASGTGPAFNFSKPWANTSTQTESRRPTQTHTCTQTDEERPGLIHRMSELQDEKIKLQEDKILLQDKLICLQGQLAEANQKNSAPPKHEDMDTSRDSDMLLFEEILGKPSPQKMGESPDPLGLEIPPTPGLQTPRVTENQGEGVGPSWAN